MAALKLFGRLNGKPVYLIKLANGDIEAEIISFGATLRALRVKGRDGEMHDVCLGYDSAEDYAKQDGYLGATVGRHANRIGGSRFELNGQEYSLSSNEGANQLHGGIEGFSHKLWSFNCSEYAVTFSLDSPDGDEGYPGNLHAEVSFSIESAKLRIEYKAVSDADTLVNMTNHAYFNLGGHESGKVYAHELCLGAEHYTPCGEGNIPTGEILPVDGTALDLRDFTRLGDRLDDAALALTEGFDHNFVLSSSPAAVLYCPKTGIEMKCSTSLEGMQLYSAGFLSGRVGKEGAVYGKHHAVCLETQHYPDAVNKQGFPSPVLRAGQKYNEWTEYEFAIR